MKWFQKCLNVLKIERQGIDTFVNCYQGYYKDGTNGTRDYRWFSIVFFVLQLSLTVLFIFSKSIYWFAVGALFVVILIFLQLSLQPYKEEFKIYSITDGFLLLNIEVIFIMIIAGDLADTKAVRFSRFSYGVAAVLTIVPIVFFATVFIWWLLIKKNLKIWCKQKFLQFQAKCENSRQLEDDDHFPHRLENPTEYTDLNAPLLPRPSPAPPLVSQAVVPVSVYGSFSGHNTKQ